VKPYENPTGAGYTGCVKRSPFVLQQRFAAELRNIRRARGYTMESVGCDLGWSKSKIGRYEAGVTVIPPGAAFKLLNHYGILGEQRKHLMMLARDAAAVPWWKSFEKDLPGGYWEFVGYEQGAGSISAWQRGTVPALLQTADYAHTVLSGRGQAEGSPPGRAGRLTELLLLRQQILSQQGEPVPFTTVLDEAVLRRPVGNAQIMRNQLHRLAEDRPSPVVQVLPLSTPSPVPTGSFTTFQFGGDSPSLPTVVGIEHLRGAHLLTGEMDTYSFTRAFQAFSEAALGPAESREFILSVVDMYE
jgi:Domain of unknown function (DUF5753)/Helix-turn-helix domain